MLRIITSGVTTTNRYYYGGFEYGTGKAPELYHMDEGLVSFASGNTTFEYYIKDHLGNTRIVAKPGTNNVPVLLLSVDYYPFGLELYGKFSSGTANKYLYNGKEMQEDIDIDWYDYGARFYDLQIGRWHVVDPLAEKRSEISVYHFTSNSPLNRIDLDGMDDYTINSKTGETKKVNTTKDQTDRVLKTFTRGKREGEIKTNRKGDPKTAIKDIKKGILKDGMNFKEDDNPFKIGGEDNLTETDIKSFALELSKYIGVEISGLSYASGPSNEVTDMVIGKYKDNHLEDSRPCGPAEIWKIYQDKYSPNNVINIFHTHPNGKLGAIDTSNYKETRDWQNKEDLRPYHPNARFLILIRVTGQRHPEEYDYTEF